MKDYIFYSAIFATIITIVLAIAYKTEHVGGGVLLVAVMTMAALWVWYGRKYASTASGSTAGNKKKRMKKVRFYGV